MDKDRAIEILRHLADGVDPFTGEVLGPDGPLQHPDAVRAMFVAIDALNASAASTPDDAPTDTGLARNGSAASKLRRVYVDRDLPPRAYEPWTAEEDSEVSDAYRSGVRIGLIADRQERTVTAVRSRLKKLGLYGYGPGTEPPTPRE